GLDGAPTKASTTGLMGDCVCCVDHLGLRGWGLVEHALFVSARRTTLRVRNSAYCVIGLGAYHMSPRGGRRSGRVTVLALPHPHEYRNINASVIVGKYLSPDSYLPGPSFESYGKAVGRSGRGRPTAGRSSCAYACRQLLGEGTYRRAGGVQV